jgi:hypothetical protein
MRRLVKKAGKDVAFELAFDASHDELKIEFNVSELELLRI